MALIDGKQKHSINIEQDAETVGESAFKNSFQVTSAEVLNTFGSQLDKVKGKQKSMNLYLSGFLQVMLFFHFLCIKYRFFYGFQKVMLQ